MRAPWRPLRLLPATAVALLVALGVALAAPRSGLPSPSGAGAGCACRIVCDCKNVLLDGVRLGHRYLSATVHLVVDRAHQVAESARDASGGEATDRRTAP
jgi:hypothetical protein